MEQTTTESDYNGVCVCVSFVISTEKRVNKKHSSTPSKMDYIIINNTAECGHVCNMRLKLI